MTSFLHVDLVWLIFVDGKLNSIVHVVKIIHVKSMSSSLDDEFGEDLGLSLDEVPGLVDFTLRHPYTLFSVKHQARFVLKTSDQAKLSSSGRLSSGLSIGVWLRWS